MWTTPASPISHRATSGPSPSRTSLTTTKRNSTSASRSEERRVGKECRSLCDWSSDVCSSDLDVDYAGVTDIAQGHVGPVTFKNIAHYDEAKYDLGIEIGRASCRERV